MPSRANPPLHAECGEQDRKRSLGNQRDEHDAFRYAPRQGRRRKLNRGIEDERCARSEHKPPDPRRQTPDRSTPADSGPRIGLTFRDESGAVCRTFHDQSASASERTRNSWKRLKHAWMGSHSMPLRKRRDGKGLALIFSDPVRSRSRSEWVDKRMQN
jgi:hypothetical protein